MQAKSFAVNVSVLRACVLGLAVVCLLAGPAFGTAITKVDVSKEADRVVIGVQGDGALDMTVFASQKGGYVGFQFPCAMSVKGRQMGIHNGRIRSLKYCNFSARPPVSRIVVSTSGFVSYSTSWSSDKRHVEISVWNRRLDAVEAKAEATSVLTKVAGSMEASTAPMLVEPVMARVPRLVQAASVCTTPVRSDSEPARVARLAPSVADEPTAESSDSPKRVSVNFLGADINDVLKALSVQSGENIVAGKDVAGNVTVSLADVEIEEALDYVAKLSGYSYVKDKDTYLVGTRDSLGSLLGGDVEARTEVIPVSYVKGDDVLAMLKEQYPALKVTKNEVSASASGAGPAGGVLVLSGAPSLVGDAAKFVAQVEDSLRARAAEEKAQVYQVKFVSPHELRRTLEALVPEVRIVIAPSDGFDLRAPEAITIGSASSGGGATIKNTEVKKDIDEIGRVQSLVFYGTEVAVGRAVDLAQQLDVKSPQIKIEAKVTALTETGEKKLGVSWEWGTFAWLETFTGGDASQVGSTETTTTSLAKAGNAYYRQPWQFAATLEALIQNGDGKLLASPTLLCVEGQPGVFFVGDEVRYVTLVQVTPTGTNVTTETANVGVQLRVVADVTPDNYITMNLHPEVSTLQLTRDQRADINLPIISRRFTDHVVRVKSGETIVIGGLIREDEIDQMSKVPILGDIPLLGQLFRHRAKIKDRTEVVMFITASILSD